MSFTYEQRKRSQGPQSQAPERTTAPGPGMEALLSGAATPTAAQKGRPIDLDGAMKAKMEHAFGDLSAVKLYESQAVGDAGAEAIARGNEIAFAPGMADFSTRSGQERLGHELSHVMSQRSGAARGSGFLANAALEARADREGAMAAAGEQVYTGPVTQALSDASPSAAAAGPMQAKRNWWGKKSKSEPLPKRNPLSEPKAPLLPPEPDLFGPDSGPLKTDDASITAAQKTAGGVDPYEKFYTAHMASNQNPTPRKGLEGLTDKLLKKYSGPEYRKNALWQNLARPKSSGEKEGVLISGLDLSRTLPSLVSDRGRGFNMSGEEIEAMADKLMAPRKVGLNQQQQDDANKLFDEGVLQYKSVLSDDLNHMEKKYGALPTQMHPHDVIPQLDDNYHQEYHFMQDASQMVKDGGKFMDFSKEDDKRFRDLTNYYSDADNQLFSYAPYATDGMFHMEGTMHKDSAAPVKKDLEASLKGPKMNEKQLKAYKSKLKTRAKKGGWKNLLFGRYK